MNTYDTGDQIRLSLVVANSSGTAIDPTALSLTIKGATTAATTYTYALAQITKDSVGNYHMDYTIPLHAGGMYYYKWTATGTAVGMAQGSFGVRVDETA